jgi:RHS repeat-associated protein
MDRTSTRTTDAGTASEKTTTFNYLGLTPRVLDEEAGGRVEKSYQYSPDGQLLSQTTFNTDGSEEDSFYGYSAHADVEQLTDAAGDTKATYGYTAYGSNDDAQFTGIDRPDAQNPTKAPYNSYRFNAKRLDSASGIYDMGFRDYSPGLNRFLTLDSYNGALADLRLGLNPWTGNRYAFGGGNPISMIEMDGHCGWNPTTWGDCAGDAISALGDAADAAWDWTWDKADAAWDWAWDKGSDVVNWVGDVAGDVGDWIMHNADALGDIAKDAAEMIGGAWAITEGTSLIAGGIAACAVSTPAAVTVVGVVITIGGCGAGAAAAAGGVGLTGIGIVAMMEGGSNLGDDLGRLENPTQGGGETGTPRPDNPKRRDDRWLKRHGVDPHEVKGELPGRGGYQDLYVDKNGNIYAVRKGTDPNEGEYIGNMRDYQD